MRWDEVIAICSIMSVAGALGLFVMKAMIRESLDEFAKQLEEKYATKEYVAARIAQRFRH